MSYQLFSCFWFSFSIFHFIVSFHFNSIFFFVSLFKRRRIIFIQQVNQSTPFPIRLATRARTGKRDSTYIFIASFVYFNIIFSLVMQAGFAVCVCVCVLMRLSSSAFKCFASFWYHFVCIFDKTEQCCIVFTMNFILLLALTFLAG